MTGELQVVHARRSTRRLRVQIIRRPVHALQRGEMHLEALPIRPCASCTTCSGCAVRCALELVWSPAKNDRQPLESDIASDRIAKATLFRSRSREQAGSFDIDSRRTRFSVALLGPRSLRCTSQNEGLEVPVLFAHDRIGRRPGISRAVRARASPPSARQSNNTVAFR